MKAESKFVAGVITRFAEMGVSAETVARGLHRAATDHVHDVKSRRSVFEDTFPPVGDKLAARVAAAALMICRGSNIEFDEQNSDVTPLPTGNQPSLSRRIVQEIQRSHDMEAGRILRVIFAAAKDSPNLDSLRDSLLTDVNTEKDVRGFFTYEMGSSALDVRLDELIKLWLHAWRHRMPPAESIEKCRVADIMGTVRDQLENNELIASIHLRRLEPGDCIGASSIQDCQVSTVEGFTSPRVEDHCVVAHSVATGPGYDGCGFSAELVTKHALPFVFNHPLYRTSKVRTSSPLSEHSTTGRQLCKSDDFKPILALLDKKLRGRKTTLESFCRSAYPHLYSVGLLPEGYRYTNAEDFIATYFRSLPTLPELNLLHSETKAVERSAERQPKSASEYAADQVTLQRHRDRLMRLFRQSTKIADSERALVHAVQFLRTMAILTQSGIFRALDGRAADGTLRFHNNLGGVLDDDFGVILASRPFDIAGVTLGQVLVYSRQFEEVARINRERARNRKKEGVPGVLADFDATAMSLDIHLPKVMGMR